MSSEVGRLTGNSTGEMLCDDSAKSEGSSVRIPIGNDGLRGKAIGNEGKAVDDEGSSVGRLIGKRICNSVGENVDDEGSSVGRLLGQSADGTPINGG